MMGINPTGLPDIGTGYDGKPKLPGVSDIPDDVKKEMDKTRIELEKVKKSILSKYRFTMALGIIPPQAAEKFDEEMELTEEEKKEKPIHLVMLIPEDNFKEIGKIRADLIKDLKDMKPKVWLTIITPIDLWNYCLDSKFEIVEAIGMSFPLHDKGMLSGLRAAEIHKSLVLRKFEKYIYSYVIAGSLVRGDAQKTSDVDIFIIIDDTDVKRMPRIELKEKLRGIIYQYIMQAEDMAGVKNVLNVQVYLLTEFWESVKDAHPVIFTFIRDGIPLYDRGGFIPWKLLLKMGKIKPSPEAIDMFMSMGDKTQEIVKRKLLDIVMGDIYWSVMTPSQALLMLYGIPPPNAYETVKEMKRIFVEKEKMLEKKYTDIFEKIVIKYYKGYEHKKINEVSGKEVDELMSDANDYMKRLKELRVDIEKRAQKTTIEQIYSEVFKILRGLFGKKSEKELVKDFEGELVNKGKAEPKLIHVLNNLVDAEKRYKNKKNPDKNETETIRKDATHLINSLIDYGQRCELAELQKNKVLIEYGEKKAELFLTNPAFLIKDGKIFKIKDKIEEANMEELEEALKQQKERSCKISKKILELLKREIGEFAISL